MMPSLPVSDAADGPLDRSSDQGALRRRLLVVTGMSGAGKTSALKALEDMGYDCVDHLPLLLLARLVGTNVDDAGDALRSLAVGSGVRTRDFTADACLGVVQSLKADPAIVTSLVYLSCDDEELHRRYSVTRHRHPLARERPLLSAIADERRMLAPLAVAADVAIDTSRLSPGDLKTILEGHFRLDGKPSLQLRVVSFSFRAGLPREADLVFDVRFLSNPYYDPELRSLTGRDEAVKRHIVDDPSFRPFLDALTRLLEPLIPRYAEEGKSYLTIAVGCTGGRHRSVFVAEQLFSWLHKGGHTAYVHHRDLSPA
jgi:UPF0042 nucleotide-binding protein